MGELEGNQKQVWARDCFSLAQIGIISAGYIVRLGSEVLPYYSVTHSSSSSFTMKSVDFKILLCLSQLEPPGMSDGPCDLSPAIGHRMKTW